MNEAYFLKEPSPSTKTRPHPAETRKRCEGAHPQAPHPQPPPPSLPFTHRRDKTHRSHDRPFRATYWMQLPDDVGFGQLSGIRRVPDVLEVLGSIAPGLLP